MPLIALSALPVHKVGGEQQTLLALSPDNGGFQNDPVLGLVEHMGIGGTLLDLIKLYVGLLAATILFIATNAGVIGASRITYSMASYRQLPEVFRRLHPRFRTPWLALLVFAGFFSILVVLPGKTDFLGTMYSFGAMLSFTVAHASVIALRVRRPNDELEFKARPNLRVRRGRLAAVRDLRRARDRGRMVRRRRPAADHALGGAELARPRVPRLLAVPQPRRQAPAPGDRAYARTRSRPVADDRVPDDPRPRRALR